MMQGRTVLLQIENRIAILVETGKREWKTNIIRVVALHVRKYNLGVC